MTATRSQLAVAERVRRADLTETPPRYVNLNPPPTLKIGYARVADFDVSDDASWSQLWTRVRERLDSTYDGYDPTDAELLDVVTEDEAVALIVRFLKDAGAAGLTIEALALGVEDKVRVRDQANEERRGWDAAQAKQGAV